MGVRSTDKTEQIVGISLILMVIIIASVITAVNVANKFQHKIETSSLIVQDGKAYRCSPVVEDKNDTNP